MMVNFLLANRFPLLLWWGPQFRQIYNDAYRPILGNKHPKAMGQPARECFPEIWEIIAPLIETPFNGGAATWMEDITLEVDRHGFVEETHFTIAYSPVPDETAQGGIGGVLATVHEISEKVIGERRLVALRDLGAHVADAKTAEEACERAAEALSRRPEDIPFALMYLLDADNRRARLVGTAGVKRGEPICPLEIELGAKKQKPWGLAEALRTEKPQVVDNIAGRVGTVPPGPWSDPPHTAVIYPIRSTLPHRFVGFLIFGISPRLRLDDLYRDFLELVTSQMATAIAIARAYEAERKRAKALAELDKAKTTFFSNISHEFRTPLTLMLGPLEDVLSKPQDHTPSETQAMLTMVHRNGLRLHKLVNTLLDFSRIEAGRIHASYEKTDLRALLNELASVFRSTAERAGLKLTVNCSRLSQPVYVDREMLEKIMLNLLSNAFKYTFHGEIRVALRESNGKALIMVQDSGIGIAARDLPNLFKRFYRVEGAKGRTHEGSGIGLAFVQELVNLHGGEIHVQSTPGKGSTFTVAIPLGSSHLPRERVHTARSPAFPTHAAGTFVEETLSWLPNQNDSEQTPPVEAIDFSANPTRTKARILLADDNADMRNYVRRLLRQFYDIEAAPDGRAALEAAKRDLPDLVLSDVMMPKLDGFGLLQALRADARTSSIPVIMLSARAGQEAKIEGLESGADDYLIKPFSAAELMARVRSQLEMARFRREIADHERQLRRELTDLNKNLEQEVIARTETLRKKEMALQQAMKLDAIGQLAGGVAHDFGNLITGITLMTEDVQRQLESENPLREDLELILGAGRKATALTRQLMAIGRRQVNNPTVLILNDKIREMTGLLPRLVGEDVEFQSRLSAEPGKIKIDPSSLEQVLMNLVFNSRDAMAKGGRITIQTTNTALTGKGAGPTPMERPAGRYVVLNIIDTGSGMSQETLDHMFEPFFTTKEPGLGTGLGLSTVYGIVKQAGGDITVKSEIDHGTTFTIRFPRVDDDEEFGLQNPSLPMAQAKGETVLVVEDEDIVRRVITRALKKQGYQVLEVSNGKEALKVSQSHLEPIHLLLTDVVMPEMNGVELAGALSQKRKDIAILYMSGHSRHIITRYGLAEDGIAFLEKSFSSDSLCRKVREVLDAAKKNA